jgi:hypothetical protein
MFLLTMELRRSKLQMVGDELTAFPINKHAIKVVGTPYLVVLEGYLLLVHASLGC